MNLPRGNIMKHFVLSVFASLALVAAPILAQDSDDGGSEASFEEYIVVTGSRRQSNNEPLAFVEKPPVIGLKRMADSAVRSIEIISDSRESDMRRREVQAMLLSAIDLAKRDGFSLVTGQLEIVEVTRANWQDQFSELAGKNAPDDDDDDDEDYDDDNGAVQKAYSDDGQNTIIRLKIKTKLDGSIGNAQQKMTVFVKSVPVTGRSLMTQKGGLALTIINPEQYRDEIYKRIAAGSKRAEGFYGPEYGASVAGLDRAIAWKQVSNTEVFLYIPYSFTILK
jgi:hypothetical protein